VRAARLGRADRRGALSGVDRVSGQRGRESGSLVRLAQLPQPIEPRGPPYELPAAVVVAPGGPPAAGSTMHIAVTCPATDSR
jgi:hypothetical protein